MGKRFSNRVAVKLITAAAASLTCWATPADAEVTIDLRASGVSGSAVISADKKDVTVSGPATITIAVIARISGINAIQQIADYSGDHMLATRNDDSLVMIAGSFRSEGNMLGDMSAASPGQALEYDPRTTPFDAPGSANGIVSDWDSDGDLDIGDGGTDATKLFVARAASPTFAISGDPPFAWSQGTGGPAGSGSKDKIVDASEQELQLGSIRFVTAAPTHSAARITFALSRGPASAQWYEDGGDDPKSLQTGTFAIDGGVLIENSFIPEPASLTLVGSAGFGLLARRKKRCFPVVT